MGREKGRSRGRRKSVVGDEEEGVRRRRGKEKKDERRKTRRRRKKEVGEREEQNKDKCKENGKEKTLPERENVRSIRHTATSLGDSDSDQDRTGKTKRYFPTRNQTMIHQVSMGLILKQRDFPEGTFDSFVCTATIQSF